MGRSTMALQSGSNCCFVSFLGTDANPGGSEAGLTLGIAATVQPQVETGRE